MEENFNEVLQDLGFDEEEDKPKGPTIDELQEKLSQTQSKISAMEEANKKMSDDYRSLRSSYDQVTDRFGKVVGFVEGAGVAKYDPETGDLIRTSNEQEPDFDKQNSDIDRQIRALEKKFDREDIDREEYREEQRRLLQEKEEIINKKAEYKYKKELEKTKPKDEPKRKPDPPPQEQSVSVEEEYAKIAEENPEIDDENSLLWKEMTRIYDSNRSKWKPGNPVNGKGDPKIYAELVAQAKSNIANYDDRFSSPRNRGYQPKEAPKSYLNKQEMENLITSGVKDKKTLNDINQSIGKWLQGGVHGSIQMEY